MKNKFEKTSDYSDAMDEMKIFKYLIGHNSEFFDGGYINIWLEASRKRSVGYKNSIYSIAFKPRHERFSWNGYTLDPMADSIKQMADRIIVW